MGYPHVYPFMEPLPIIVIGYLKKENTTSSPRPTRRTACVLSAPPPVSHRHQRLVPGSSTTWTRPAVDPMGLGLVPENDGKNMKHHWHLIDFDGWSRLIMVDNGHLGGRFGQALVPQYVDVKMLQSTPPPKEKYTLSKILCDLFGNYCNVAKPIINHPQWWFMTLDVPL